MAEKKRSPQAISGAIILSFKTKVHNLLTGKNHITPNHYKELKRTVLSCDSIIWTVRLLTSTGEVWVGGFHIIHEDCYFLRICCIFPFNFWPQDMARVHRNVI